jgi:hypothetical protein
VCRSQCYPSYYCGNFHLTWLRLALMRKRGRCMPDPWPVHTGSLVLIEHHLLVCMTEQWSICSIHRGQLNTTNDGTVVDLFDMYHVIRWGGERGETGGVALWRYCNLTFGIGLRLRCNSDRSYDEYGRHGFIIFTPNTLSIESPLRN